MKTMLLLLIAVTAMTMDLTATLKQEEGFSATMYRDHLGYPTIGYGHRCGSDQKEITKEQAEKMLSDDVAEAQKGVDNLIGKNAPQEVKDIVTCMVFQMGLSGVSKFKTMLACISKADYKGASVAMMNSKWAKQTPKRARRMSLDMAAVK